MDESSLRVRLQASYVVVASVVKCGNFGGLLGVPRLIPKVHATAFPFHAHLRIGGPTSDRRFGFRVLLGSPGATCRDWWGKAPYCHGDNVLPRL